MARDINGRLTPIARRNGGVFTVQEARTAGVRADSLRRWAKTNPDVQPDGNGVYIWYLDDDNIDWNLLPLRRAWAYAGREAILAAPSVLEYNHIGDIGGMPFTFIVPKRRRNNPAYRWMVAQQSAQTVTAGIPSSSIARALKESVGRVDGDQLTVAIRDALTKGLISKKEAANVQ